MSDLSLAEIDALRARARQDSQTEAVVLIAVGIVATVGQILGLASGSMIGWSAAWYWLATPVAFAGCWVALRRRRLATGVGTPTATVGRLAAALILLALLIPFAFFLFGPFLTLMGGVLLIGVSIRSRLMIVWGCLAGVIGTLASLFFFGNRSGDLGHWTPWLDDLAGLAVALVTLVLGVLAARRSGRP